MGGHCDGIFNGPALLGEQLAQHGGNAAWAVDVISNTTLGKAGAILALLGVVVAPITSGDTAFRGADLLSLICSISTSVRY